MSLREAQERDPSGTVVARPPARSESLLKRSGMSWFTVDCDLPDHPKLLELPNDSARYGWIVTLARAKRQRTPGQFDSERHYRGVLHRYAKYLPNYLAVGLLEQHEDHSLTVHDWRRYQWAVAKARQREDIAGTPARHPEDNGETISGPIRTQTLTRTQTDQGSTEALRVVGGQSAAGEPR